MSILRKISVILTGLLVACSSHAGQLSIIIDDFGYRPTEENKVLQMPQAISVAVLPDATRAREMAIKAHQQGHEVLIHLPMAPLSKQPLEKNTLRPDMSSEEIARIIREAVAKVPYAIGLNNHMGSAMTASLPGMQKVMQVLDNYNMYFLDSMTIGNSQSTRAAEGTRVKVIKRRIFLDDTQNEADIRKQFLRAVHLAQRDGSAIAIGHPHPGTVKVLQQMLPMLPADITLVRPSQLLRSSAAARPQLSEPKSAPGHRPFHGVETCPVSAEFVPASRALNAITESVADSAGIHFIKTYFSGLKLGLGKK